MDCHWLILGHMALTKFQWIPIVIHLSNCTPLRVHYSTWSKLGGKWYDRRWEKLTTHRDEHNKSPQHKHKASSYKATIFKVIPEEKQQLVEEKDAENIRRVLCKSFTQWFWELNLCFISTESTVLIRSGYSFVAVQVKVYKYNKTHRASFWNRV